MEKYIYCMIYTTSVHRHLQPKQSYLVLSSGSCIVEFCHSIVRNKRQ